MFPSAFDEASWVQALDIDLFSPGNILYLDGSSLKTLDPTTFTTYGIVGSVTYHWYNESREGVGYDAPFMMPTDFEQIYSTHVVILELLHTSS